MSPRFFLCVNGTDVTGPFSNDELRLALARREVATSTLGCAEGTETWLPLSTLCPDLFKRAEKEASPKQKALMAFLRYPAPESATAAEAREWLDQACADKHNQQRLQEWRTACLRLHPNLFADELEEQKVELTQLRKDRARDLCEYCNNEKEEYDLLDESFWPLRKLTIKQCQKAVDHLDAQSPGWDANLRDGEFGSLNDEVVRGEFLPALMVAASEAVKDEAAAREMASATPLIAEVNNPSPRRKLGCLQFALIALVSVVVILVVIDLVAPSPSQPQHRAEASPTPSPTPAETPAVEETPTSYSADESVPSITVDGITYRNPMIVKEYPRSVFIRHEHGQVFVEKTKIGPEVISGLPRVDHPVPSPNPDGR